MNNLLKNINNILRIISINNKKNISYYVKIVYVIKKYYI